jgi:hypothetical protein
VTSGYCADVPDDGTAEPEHALHMYIVIHGDIGN